MVNRVTVRMGSSVKSVAWEAGLLKVGGDIGVIGERYL
jgi:hypothetical protein